MFLINNKKFKEKYITSEDGIFVSLLLSFNKTLLWVIIKHYLWTVWSVIRNDGLWRQHTISRQTIQNIGSVKQFMAVDSFETQNS